MTNRYEPGSGGIKCKIRLKRKYSVGYLWEISLHTNTDNTLRPFTSNITLTVSAVFLSLLSLNWHVGLKGIG